MSELSPQGQALLRATRAALRPEGADKARVLASLQARLGAPPPAAAPAIAQVSRGIWAAAAAAVVGVGGLVAVGLSSEPTPVVAPAPAAVVVPAPAQAPEAPAEAPPSPPVEAAPTPAVAGPSAPARRGDRLAEEVAILSQAAKDLRAGRAAAALSALNEHQKKFPGGALTLERRAARAEALCSLGRMPEAQAELAALTRSAPQSPLTVRAQERCRVRPTKR